MSFVTSQISGSGVFMRDITYLAAAPLRVSVESSRVPSRSIIAPLISMCYLRVKYLFNDNTKCLECQYFAVYEIITIVTAYLPEFRISKKLKPLG